MAKRSWHRRKKANNKKLKQAYEINGIYMAKYMANNVAAVVD